MSDKDDFDDVAVAGSGETFADEKQGSSDGHNDCEARRRLEARLEEQRLKKLIQDYDFDI